MAAAGPQPHDSSFLSLLTPFPPLTPLPRENTHLDQRIFRQVYDYKEIGKTIEMTGLYNPLKWLRSRFGLHPGASLYNDVEAARGDAAVARLADGPPLIGRVGAECERDSLQCWLNALTGEGWPHERRTMPSLRRATWQDLGRGALPRDLRQFHRNYRRRQTPAPSVRFDPLARRVCCALETVQQPRSK
jgi:hypothetical protein